MDCKVEETLLALDGVVCHYYSTSHIHSGYLRGRCLKNVSVKVFSAFVREYFFLCEQCYLDSRHSWSTGSIFYDLSGKQLHVTDKRYDKRYTGDIDAEEKD